MISEYALGGRISNEEAIVLDILSEMEMNARESEEELAFQGTNLSKEDIYSALKNLSNLGLVFAKNDIYSITLLGKIVHLGLDDTFEAIIQKKDLFEFFKRRIPGTFPLKLLTKFKIGPDFQIIGKPDFIRRVEDLFNDPPNSFSSSEKELLIISDISNEPSDLYEMSGLKTSPKIREVASSENEIDGKTIRMNEETENLDFEIKVMDVKDQYLGIFCIDEKACLFGFRNLEDVLGWDALVYTEDEECISWVKENFYYIWNTLAKEPLEPQDMDVDTIEVLLIEDNPGDAYLIRKTLIEDQPAQFNLTHVKKLGTGLKKLNEGQFDVVLCDLGLPDSQGFDTFYKVKSKVPDMPLIILSGLNDETIAVKAVHNGAQDYLVKGQVDSNLLNRAIRYSIERKKMEVSLRESEKKYSTLVEMSGDGITLIQCGKIIFANRSACEMLGFAESEVIGVNIYGLLSKRLKNMFGLLSEYQKRMIIKTFLDMTKRRSNAQIYQLPSIKKTGEIIWIEVHKNSIFYKKNRANILLLRDITDRKRLEDELKKYTEHLEEEVKRQTSELVQAEKMSTIGELVAGVAHEINNPLAYLKTNCKFLHEDLMDLKKGFQQKDVDFEVFKEIEELLDTNMNGIRKIATITKALKRFATSDTGEKAFSNINDGIKDTLVMAHNQLRHRVTVNEDFGELPLIDCNIGQLNQVFMNIIMNSSQSMDTGEIWIRTWFDDYDIHIEIKDNGGGIPEDEVCRIFDPFFTTKEGCTGLGLSISYRIIKDHNGEIKVESEVGKGTTIKIELPPRA